MQLQRGPGAHVVLRVLQPVPLGELQEQLVGAGLLASHGCLRRRRRSFDEDLVEWLYSLPPQTELDGILYVHGSPLSDVDSFPPQPSDDDERMLAGVRDRTVVFGHSHQQFRRPGPSGTDLVNPGSVGMPLDSDVRAAWATWDGDFEFRRTEYDVARAAAGYRSMGGDFGEFAARRIERGSD